MHAATAPIDAACHPNTKSTEKMAAKVIMRRSVQSIEAILVVFVVLH
jgi:hypothetical protein